MVAIPPKNRYPFISSYAYRGPRSKRMSMFRRTLPTGNEPDMWKMLLFGSSGMVLKVYLDGQWRIITTT